MLYSDKVMEHFTNPHNVGELPDANGVGEVGNAKCGDIMKMYLKIKDDRIEDVKDVYKRQYLSFPRKMSARRSSFPRFRPYRAVRPSAAACMVC